MHHKYTEITMDQRLSIITLGVNNLKQARAFYENTLGWAPLGTSDESIVFFHLGGMLLSLYPHDSLAEDVGIHPGRQGFRGVTLAYNATSREVVDRIFTDLDARGATIVKHPQPAFWGGYSGYISDPDGHLWEIAYNPYLELDADGRVVSA